MFTGLITDIGVIVGLQDRPNLRRFRIACGYDVERIAIGASIACGGPCLTVIDKGRLDDDRTWFDVEAAAETLARTNVGEWREGRRLNLERSLALGDELGGHLMVGHVDGLAEIVERRALDGAVRFDLRAPKDLARFIAEKGSISLDGTSLTVNEVDGDHFSITLIPHSLAVTTWNERQPGDKVNLEVDLLARYVARLQETS